LHDQWRTAATRVVGRGTLVGITIVGRGLVAAAAATGAVILAAGPVHADLRDTVGGPVIGWTRRATRGTVVP
jgi:hypothetical protein